MPIGSNCESCGVPPPRVESPFFPGETGTHSYCARCSEDLCRLCLLTKPCREACDKKHHEEGDAQQEESAEGA